MASIRNCVRRVRTAGGSNNGRRLGMATALLLGGGFAGYELGSHDGGTPVEHARTDLTTIQRDCGQVALDHALKSAGKVEVGSLTPERLAGLQGLQTQVQTEQAKCFADTVNGVVADVNRQPHVPAVQAEVNVQRGDHN